MNCRRVLAAAGVSLLLVPAASGQEWTANERVQTYAVSGSSGIELYRSIGERGPQAGIGRAIAITDFDLKWSRDYRPQPDGSCMLVSAKPFLTITYRLPRPSAKLAEPTRSLWASFVAGVEVHERVHGRMIREMVQDIQNVSIGLSAADDPQCRKVRETLQGHLGRLSQEQRQRSRDFDRLELSNGGNVHQLVLTLVNGEDRKSVV